MFDLVLTVGLWLVGIACCFSVLVLGLWPMILPGAFCMLAAVFFTTFKGE